MKRLLEIFLIIVLRTIWTTGEIRDLKIRLGMPPDVDVIKPESV
jgi:hypothetical protein